MAQFMSESEITYKISCPHTPQQNGIAKRKNKHFSEVARALLFHANLSKKFWFDAYATAAYLVNRIPSQVLDHTSPYETLYRSKPDYTLLRVFGCLCYPFLGDICDDRLSPKSIPCIFVGYAPNHKGYLCYDPHSLKSYTSRHVTFHESTFSIPSPMFSKTIPTTLSVIIPSMPFSHLSQPPSSLSNSNPSILSSNTTSLITSNDN